MMKMNWKSYKTGEKEKEKKNLNNLIFIHIISVLE